MKSMASAVVVSLVLAAAAAFAGDPCSAPDTQSKASQAQGLVQQRKFAEAEGPARAALAACPTHAAGAAALGGALVGQGKHDEAIDRMSAVIRAKADVAYAYFWRGQAYYNKKQPDKMVGDFETFLKLAPNAAEAATVKQLLAGLKK